MDFMVCVDKLDDLLYNAKPVFLTNEVRTDPERLRSQVSKLRAACPSDAGEVVPLVDALEAEVAAAKPVPLTDQVRVDKERVYELLDQMRARFRA